MKTLSLIFLTLSLLLPLSAVEPLAGVWLTSEDNTKVETYQKDGKWFGKILSSGNPMAKLGTDILREFQLEGKVWKGKLFAPKRDKIVDATIVPSPDQLAITVREGLLCRTLRWNRDAAK